jgi:hypothetical protein
MPFFNVRAHIPRAHSPSLMCYFRTTPALVYFPQGCVAWLSRVVYPADLTEFSGRILSLGRLLHTIIHRLWEMPEILLRFSSLRTLKGRLSLVRSRFTHVKGFDLIVHWLDANPYIPNGWGRQWYGNTNNLWVKLVVEAF